MPEKKQDQEYTLIFISLTNREVCLPIIVSFLKPAPVAELSHFMDKAG